VANYPYGSPNAICGETPYKNGFLMPDRFESFERFDVPGNTARPVWLSCNIPSDVTPGVYIGNIEVNAKNEHTVLNVKITVQNQTLPKPHDWKHRLDVWQNPWIIADYYHVKPWSEEHKMLLKKHLKLYAEAGGTYITTYGVHSPWGDNEYAIERGMIEWIKVKDGSWKFDYSVFDQYVELAMSLGIDKAITIYTPIPWGERFRYIDEATGNYNYEQWLPSSDAFKKNWTAFLSNLKLHLEQKGWFNKTYLGINENAMDQTLTAIHFVKNHSAKWKITYAGDWHAELDKMLDDYSFLYGKESTKDEVKARAARGQTTTFYVCCNPAKPNNFLFSPPVEGRWISWYSAAHGYSGFLRWAYDSWPADPLRDARYGSWAAGDSYLVYPGGNSCIRFEKLREGIVDYEKIRIVRELVAKSGNAALKKNMSEFETHLQTLNAEKTFDEEKLKSDIEKGKVLLNRICASLPAR
ncbi:MAG: glycoside hydrolase domain-containing protein, partial [Bacteroidota bacterium]